jgi:RimJ/RimL family protein N-acetyltransferase
VFVKRSINESGRLVYELLTKLHASALRDALIDPRTYACISPPNSTTEAELAEEFARRVAGPSDGKNEIWWNFAVRRREGPFIGRIEATFHHGLAEIAYVFGPSYWGCGYATESLRWLHSQIRDTQLAVSVWAAVTPGNTRSIRLLERLGYSEALPGPPQLLSYDEGDRVYCKQFSADV